MRARHTICHQPNLTATLPATYQDASTTAEEVDEVHSSLPTPQLHHCSHSHVHAVAVLTPPAPKESRRLPAKHARHSQVGTRQQALVSQLCSH